MKNLAKGIVKYVGAFFLAASCCTSQPDTVPGYITGQQVKQVIEEEKQDKATLEEKLKTIHDALKARDMSFIVFGSPNSNYMFSIENIDKDGKPDYVLLVGAPGDKRFPLGPALMYIEDTSKKTGPGNVDKVLAYGNEGGIRKVIRVTIAEFEKVMKEFEELHKNSPDDKKALLNAQQKLFSYKSNIVGANALYMNIISGLYDFVKQAEQETPSTDSVPK